MVLRAIVLFVLLLAAAAFVADVLSPLTPTPNAHSMSRLLSIFEFALVALVFAQIGIISVESRVIRYVNIKFDRGMLVVFFCSFLR